jgi:hypothetical protein
MLSNTSIQALFAAALPAGTRFFLVAAIPVDDPLSITSTDRVTASATTEASSPTDHEEAAKLARLVRALQKVEPNDTRKVILDSLLATTDGDWLPFASMITAIEKAGVSHADAPGRAQAALRDLSWQFKTHLPAEDLADCTVAIDALATRRRFGKETRYRLTKLGRAALTSQTKKIQ